eukprot:403348266
MVQIQMHAHQEDKDKLHVKKLRDQVKSIFFDDEDREKYGFTDDVLDFVVNSCLAHQKTGLSVAHSQINNESDQVKLDDTWLKSSILMYETHRLQYQNDRLPHFKSKNVVDYHSLASSQYRHKNGIVKKAGEIICTFLEIDPDQFMYFRDAGSDITIIDHLDPVQFMIPLPKNSKVIEGLDKPRASVILNEVLNAASNAFKDYKDLIQVKKDHLQGLYHFLIEDILWVEFQMDYEDFKRTVINHGILADQSIVSQISEIFEDLNAYYESHFYESD